MRLVATSPTQVRIRATLTNTSEHSVVFGRGVGASFGVSVNTENGTSAPKTIYWKRFESSPLEASSGPLIVGTLDPGKSVSEDIDVDLFYDMNLPGTYHIEASWNDVRSNAIQVSVAPRLSGGVAPEAMISFNAAQAAARIITPASRWPLTLLITADEGTIHTGQGMHVQTGLANVSDRAIMIASDGAANDYAVEVRDEDGGKPRDRQINLLHKQRILSGEFSTGARLVSPSATIVGTIDISDYVDLSRPGAYAIQLWRRLPEEFGRGEVRSNVITVTVVAGSGN